MRLQNKVALITGGARGQGAVEAKLFASEGAKVVIADVLESKGKQIEAEINETGGECLFVRLDVTQEREWESAIDKTLSSLSNKKFDSRALISSAPRAFRLFNSR